MPEVKFSGTKDQYESGATRDAESGDREFERYDLISPFATKRVAIVYGKGAKNHGDRNWEKGLPASRLIRSALRHIFQALMGMKDEDHIAHAVWNLNALMHFQHTMPEMIDIPALKEEEKSDARSDDTPKPTSGARRG